MVPGVGSPISWVVFQFRKTENLRTDVLPCTAPSGSVRFDQSVRTCPTPWVPIELVADGPKTPVRRGCPGFRPEIRDLMFLKSCRRRYPKLLAFSCVLDNYLLNQETASFGCTAVSRNKRSSQLGLLIVNISLSGKDHRQDHPELRVCVKHASDFLERKHLSGSSLECILQGAFKRYKIQKNCILVALQREENHPFNRSQKRVVTKLLGHFDPESVECGWVLSHGTFRIAACWGRLRGW